MTYKFDWVYSCSYCANLIQTVTNFNASLISFIIKEVFTIATSLLNDNLEDWYYLGPKTIPQVYELWPELPF